MRSLVAGVFALALAGAAPGATAPAPHRARPHAAPVRRHAAAARKPAPPPAPAVPQLAAQIRAVEELGGWGRAAEMLRTLRARVPADPDLELTLAWCEARSGQLDSAAARLAAPVLTRAADDSMPPGRWVRYPWGHEVTWLDGRFDGWHWYVWRTRAEVAAARGHWDEALAAERRAVASRPMAGVEWYLRALCAAHTGLWDEARDCTREALLRDPSVPEAHDLAGLLAWRDGRRKDALAEYGTAIGLDSSDASAALARLRLRLPAATPDTLPGELLTGERRAGLLTAPEGPKPEVFMQLTAAAAVTHRRIPADVDSTGVPNSERPRVNLTIAVLVDSHGRASLFEPQTVVPESLSADKLWRLAAALVDWRFRPAVRQGFPVASWVGLEFAVIP